MTGQRGAAPLELALGVLLLLVPVALLVLSFGPWMERRTFVRVAASEAARAVVVSGKDDLGVRIEELALRNGLDGVRIGLCGAEPQPVDTDIGSCAPLERGGLVSVRVEIDVPGIRTPFGTVGSLVTGFEHVEHVDDYRSLP